MLYEIDIDGQTLRLELTRDVEGDGWRCKQGDREWPLDVALIGPDTISLIYEGKAFELQREHLGESIQIRVNGEPYKVEVSDPRSFRGRRKNTGPSDGPRRLAAPMPGKVVRVLVREGQPVKEGEGIMVVEAMKMQNEIKSPKNGVVQKIVVEDGASVNAGDLLAVVE